MEGGKSRTSNLKIGLLAGNDMYEAALAKGLPFKPRAKWSDDNVEDFEVSEETYDRYNYYLNKVASSGSLGELFNSHMTLYYQWRFYSIQRKLTNKSNKTEDEEEKRIKESDDLFEANKAESDAKIAEREKRANNDQYSLDRAIRQMRNGSASNADTNDLESKRDASKDAYLREVAKKDALPDESKLEQILEIYDKRLYDDALAILKTYRKQSNRGALVDQTKRANLRPHYKAMMDAFEAEFIDKKGMKDQKIIDFFEIHVHDSLAGFAKDATLPSDPRAIYLGGDVKYQYAMVDQSDASARAA